MSDDQDTTFDDFDEDIDDNEAVEQYATELKAAVEALGIDVIEPGEEA